MERIPSGGSKWVQASQFSHPEQLQDYLKEDNPEEEKI